MWNDIKAEYAPFIHANAVDTEVDLWRHKIAKIDLDTDTLCKVMDAAYHLHPNMYTIFTVLLTMPVSTAPAEKSFSTLRRLKSYLRNIRTQEHLTGLALWHIHRSINHDVNRVINEFDATGQRRIALVYNANEDSESSNDSSDDGD